MNKTILILGLALAATCGAGAQTLLTLGNQEVSRDEFLRAYTRNMGEAGKNEQSLREYLGLYTQYKLKVTAARDLKLDTMQQLRNDLMNFRRRLEDSYLPPAEEIIRTTGLKKNPAVQDEMLYLYADSAAYAFLKTPCPIAKETMFTLGNTSVKVSEWLSWAKDYKLNRVYKGETNRDLLEQFTRLTATNYYRAHLEEYNADFRYQLQEFKEGNLYFEVMDKKVWTRKSSQADALRRYFDTHKEKYAWKESAVVILVNARSYAYADYASENMKKGMHWKALVENSEGMILGDSARYELGQLPITPGSQLQEGMITPIVKNDADNSAGFVKIIRLIPAGQPRSFEEARHLVASDFQQQQETEWLQELAMKYPVKLNQPVFQSLLK